MNGNKGDLVSNGSAKVHLSTWHKGWLVGLVVLLAGYFPLSSIWFSTGHSLENADFHSAYRSHARAYAALIWGMVETYAAFYSVLTMLFCDPSGAERRWLLVFWTLVPPLWFFFEYYFWFDNHESVRAFEFLKTGQETSARVWQAVLALLISDRIAFRLGRKPE